VGAALTCLRPIGFAFAETTSYDPDAEEGDDGKS
jgi:hypothetical protein